MKITPCIIKIPKGAAWVKYCRRTRCVIALRTTRPRRPRAPVHPCFPTQDLSAQAAYQGQFRGLARDWKRGSGWAAFPFSHPAVAIDKQAWREFAFAHPYATNTFPVRCGAIRLPWDYRKRTGYQLFQAWNQAASSAQFFRLQYTHNWNPKFPFTFYATPPATYAPLFVDDLELIPGDFPPFLAPVIHSNTAGQHFYAVLSASKPARRTAGKAPKALEYLSGHEFLPADPPPVQTTDGGSWKGRWGCYPHGYVDVSVYLVHSDTGTPGPRFTKTFLLNF